MSTERQIQANRENAQKSTGPKTEAGKAISSQNATRHGLLARTIVQDFESLESFQEILETLTAEHQPINESERFLVESMAIARWRQLRVWTVQKIDLDREMAQTHESEGTLPERAALAFKNSSGPGSLQDTTHRYETTYDRRYNQAFKQLRELKKERRS